MSKLKSFFIGFISLLLAITAMFMVVLVYRASTRSAVKTYIFQMDNAPANRVGPLQDVDTMKPEELRLLLIQKYVTEYFKVIPSTTNTSQKETVAALSSSAVYNTWLRTEAKVIEQMATAKMFRTVEVLPTNITTTKDEDWFEVQYGTRTWQESNNMFTQIKNDLDGRIRIRVIFEPGFIPKVNIRKVLENGDNPVKLFKFRVIDIQ